MSIEMPQFINIADLKDPDDPQGRSYREVNREKPHRIPIGALVELKSGARAFVVKHTRDCDQTPLYSLAIDPDDCQFSMDHGYDEKSLKQITIACTGPETAPASDA
jgi:hypothetical protein